MDTTAGNTQVTLTREYPEQEIPVFLFWTSPIRLVIRPAIQVDTADYELRVSCRSSTGIYDSWSDAFRWSSEVVPSGSCDEPVAGLQLRPAADPIDFNTTSVSLQRNALPCAGGYKIYAKDDRNNPSWLMVWEDPTDYDFGTITSSFTLPRSFDRYQVDNVQTPFAGIEVTFSVVPTNAGYPEPGGAHATVAASDVVSPTIRSLDQIGSGVNTTGRPMPLRFWVALGEFMSASVTAPTLEIKEGANPEFILDPNDGPWAWDAGRTGGSFDFTLPDRTDASGDSVRVVFDRLEDLSGNFVDGPVRTPWAEIVSWGGEFDFEGSGQGWTRTGEGWGWGTPQNGPRGAHSGTGAWGTTLSGSYGSGWNTDLTSPVLYVPTNQPTLIFWCWYSMDCYNAWCTLQILDPGQETVAEYICSSDEEWEQVVISLQDYAGQVIQLRFHFASSGYQGYQYPGFYLDDVRISSADKTRVHRLF